MTTGPLPSPAPEFSRPVRIDTIGEAPRALTIAADEAERHALARRFGLVAVDRLEAEAMVSRDSGGLRADGHLHAAVVQSCVASGVPLPAQVEAPFTLRFLPEEKIEGGEDVELSAEDLDLIGYSGGAIDLGEAVAETLALELDPYPRAPDAEDRLRAAGVLDEGDAGPFAALKALKDKLGGG